MKITNTRLYDAVYKNDKEMLRAMGIEHACANMGMEHILDDVDVIEQAYQQLAEAHYDAALSELGYDNEGPAEARAFESVDEEVNHWIESSKEDLEEIKRRGLPLSLRSSRIVFAKGSTYQG